VTEYLHSMGNKATTKGVRKSLGRMVEHGIVSTSGHTKGDNTGAVYWLTGEDCADEEEDEHNMVAMHRMHRESIMQCLREGLTKPPEISKRSGCCRVTVLAHLREIESAGAVKINRNSRPFIVEFFGG